jgi:hypothetical protein
MRFDDPAFAIWMDEHHIIHVRTFDVWTMESADRYWTAFRPFLAESRARLGGHAKALIDRRGAPVMSTEMVHTMRDGIAENYAPGDRLALVVDSSPLKLQVRKSYTLENLDAFLSYEAALAWLIHH